MTGCSSDCYCTVYHLLISVFFPMRIVYSWHALEKVQKRKIHEEWIKELYDGQTGSND